MDQFTQFMQARLDRATAYQAEKGRQVRLSLDEFIGLHSPYQLTNLRKRLHEGTINSFLGCKWGYVLGWRDKTAFESGILDRDNARILTREASLKATFKQRGDTHSADVRLRISAKLTGRSQKNSHIKKRAAAQRGVKRGPMSDAHKQAIRNAKAERAAALAASQSRTCNGSNGTNP